MSSSSEKSIETQLQAINANLKSLMSLLTKVAFAVGLVALTQLATVVLAEPLGHDFQIYVPGESDGVLMLHNSTALEAGGLYERKNERQIACISGGFSLVAAAVGAGGVVTAALLHSAHSDGSSGGCNYGMQYYHVQNDIIGFQYKAGSCGYDAEFNLLRNDINAILSDKLGNKLPNAVCVVASDQTGANYAFTFGTDGNRVQNLPCYQGMNAPYCEWNR